MKRKKGIVQEVQNEKNRPNNLIIASPCFCIFIPQSSHNRVC